MQRPPIGARPGTLVISETAPPPKISWMRYTPATVEEAGVTDISQLDGMLSSEGVSWIDVQGLGDEQVVRAIAKRFEIHPLALEDVVHGRSRSKAEAYEQHLLIITRMLRIEKDSAIVIEQIGLFIGERYVLSVQPHYGDVFDSIRARVRAGRGPIRRSGADYLAYALLDAIIDAYFPVVEKLGDELETLEERIMVQPNNNTLRRLNSVRSQLLAVRRAVVPQRETVNELIRDDSPFISDAVRLYLRDVYDHCVQTNEAVEAAREVASGLLSTYLSVIGNRTNDVMKVLTIVASIFVPLTFMAGIYGMNFEHMPELKLAWGYPALLGAMLIVGVGMLFYFQRKGWIGSGDGSDDGPVSRE